MQGPERRYRDEKEGYIDTRVQRSVEGTGTHERVQGHMRGYRDTSEAAYE